MAHTMIEIVKQSKAVLKSNVILERERELCYIREMLYEKGTLYKHK